MALRGRVGAGAVTGAVTGAGAVAGSGVVALVLLASVIVLAGLTGPVTPSVAPAPPRNPQVTASGTAKFSTPTTPPADVYRRSPRASAAHRFPVELASVVVVIAGLTLAVVVVVALRLRRQRQRHPEPGPVPPPATGLPDGGMADSGVAGSVATAADAGLALLSAATDVGDAVIACWVRLEQGAAAAGRRRHPAQTPTEFTTDLLLAGIGEEPAVRELLALYHRARFGSHPLPAEAADRAIACLEAIRAAARTRTAAR